MSKVSKVLPRTDHEGPEEEKKCSSTLSLTSTLDGGGWLTSRLGSLPLIKGRGTHCTGSWVDPRVSLDRFGISRPYRDSIPVPSSP